MEEEKNVSPISFEENSINLREELEKYLYYWKWFLLSIIISLTMAFLYLRYTHPFYNASINVLIKNSEEKNGLIGFNDLNSVMDGGSNIKNEIELIKSRTNLLKVIENLNLDVVYFSEGKVLTSENYSKSPINVSFVEKLKVESDGIDLKNFIVKILSNNQYELKSIDKISLGTFYFNDTIQDYNIIVQPKFDKIVSFIEKEIIVRKQSLIPLASSIQNRLKIENLNGSDILMISLTDKVLKRSVDVLNELVIVFNNDAIEDKNQIFNHTTEFIKKRLEIINDELNDVEKNAENFKRTNRLINLSSQSETYLRNADEYDKKIIEIETELTILDLVKNDLNNNSDDFLPEVIGVSNSEISSKVSEYNELVQKKKRLLINSTSKNPAIIVVENQISPLKFSILKSINNLNSNLLVRKKALKTEGNKLNNKIASVPKSENIFRAIQRQQGIKESLYLYLLQKREETALAVTATSAPAKIVDEAYGEETPISPKNEVIYLGAIMIGFLFPLVFVYLKNLLNNKVHTRKDIEKVMRTPILGDIPKSKSAKKVVVSDNARDATAESFRLLRTNIDFMLSKVEEKSKVIYISSTLSGEGKTFISINLASVLSLTSKKVLLVGADIRKPKITDYLDVKQGKGLTHFLMDNSLNVSEVIDRVEEHNFDMLHSGIIAPNPSELLMNGRFDEVIAYGKANYDYVIVDTAPVNLVTDTLLLSDHAHLFIYVTRAGYLDKRLLEIPKKLYEEKRLPNMAILLNDTDSEKGYGYGYGYGYGGYGEEVEKKKWWQLFSKN